MTLVISNETDSMDITSLIAQNGLKLSKKDIESGVMTMDGRTHRGKIASKETIEVTCLPMLFADYSELAALLSSEYLGVQYTDPETGNTFTTMCVRERPASLLVHYSNGHEYWSGISFKLEEV